MKRALATALMLLLALSLAACGKKVTADRPAGGESEVPFESCTKVEITKENFDLYFVYKEYVSYTKGENSNDISSAQISYGYELREGFLAAEVPEDKPTLEINFTADGVVNSGSYTISYATLDYSGTTQSTETTQVSGTLGFWPQGNRTVLYPYGVYRDTYVIRLENFRLTSVSGYIYLLNQFDT